MRYGNNLRIQVLILLPCVQADASFNFYKALTSVYENDYHSFLVFPLLHEIETQL